MHIEDLISLVVSNGPYKFKCNGFDSKVLFNFWDNAISKNLPLSEKQGNLAVKVLKRYKIKLSEILNKDITVFLDNPTFRIPLRKNLLSKNLSIQENSTFVKAIHMEFPYDEKMVNELRLARTQGIMGTWNPDKKSWVFPLSEKNLQFLWNCGLSNHFSFDDEFKNYVDQIDNLVKNAENIAPMLVMEENEFKIKNVDSNFPKITSKNVLNAIFEARKLGICVWDEKINIMLNDYPCDPIIKDFLRTDPGKKFQINNKKTEINSLDLIVNNLSPCLVVIPGGDELEKTKLVYNFMKQLGMDDKNISVLFRLPSETHKEFNDFVKTNKLNTPIDEHTRAVFISCRFPKTILKSKIKFKSTIVLGSALAHYTVRDFVENQQNLIEFSGKTKQGVLDFAIM